MGRHRTGSPMECLGIVTHRSSPSNATRKRRDRPGEAERELSGATAVGADGLQRQRGGMRQLPKLRPPGCRSCEGWKMWRGRLKMWGGGHIFGSGVFGEMVSSLRHRKTPPSTKPGGERPGAGLGAAGSWASRLAL